MALAGATIFVGPSPALAVDATFGGPTQTGEGMQLADTFATAGCSTSSNAPSIDWGDGQVTSGYFGPSGAVSGQHAYTEEGTFQGTASYQDDCGTHTAPFTVIVSDAAVSGSGTVFNATAGSAFTGAVGHFTDADPLGSAADYTASISWGDGSSSVAAVAAVGGGFDASGNHTYASSGSYQVSVVFTDAGGASVSVGSTATVANPEAPPPAATFTLASNRPVVNGVIAFDGSRSNATGGVSRFAWDFDGSGRFDATCPSNLPVAYKVFDTPGSHNVALRVSDPGGQQSTFQGSFTLGRLAGTRVLARRASNPALANVSNFWCGDRASIPRGDIGFLPRFFDSEVRAVGVEVSQGVVPDPPRPSGLSVISRALVSGKARAAGLSKFQTLSNDQQNPPDNRISWLQKGGKTVVRVYASALLSPFGNKVSNVQMRLYGFDNGNQLPGSPLLSETGPLDVPLGPPYTTHAMRIGYDPLEGNLPAFTFTLPDSWTLGNLAMLARPVLVGGRLDRQCSTPECSFSQQAGSGDFQFNNTGLFIIRSVAMTATGQQVTSTPSSLFDQAINVSPVAVLPSPFQATLNIDSITNCTPSPTDDCTDPNGKASALIGGWLNDHKPIIPSLIKVITIGVHRGYSQIQGWSGWPAGDGCRPAPDGALCETMDQSPVSQVDAGRPLTSVAHEMFHDLGRPHADDSSSGCAGNGEGKPDSRGHLAGIGLDRHPGSGGSPTSPYRILSPDIAGQQPEQYDLMSYCAGNYPENDSWLSPHNWNTVASDWIFYIKRATASSLSPFAAAPSQAVQVSGFADGKGTHVTHIEPVEGAGASAAIAAAPPQSPYHAVTKNTAGATVADTPLSVTYGHLDALHRGDPAIPTASFHGVLSALGAQRLDITRSGALVASQLRSAHRPLVELLAPQRGTIGRRPTVQVRWRASDADHDPLTAYVDFSTDAGRQWHTVYVGAGGGSVRLPRSYFTGSRNARVRVRVNDGFNETAAVSRALRAVGSPPFVTLSSPRGLQRIRSDASLYLRGYAFDDAFRLIGSNQLRWFLGSRQLGTGSSVSANDLPPGRQRIQLMARDGAGRTATASVAIFVAPARPFFVTFIAPAKVARRARMLQLTLATNGPATLQTGGQRVSLGRRARRVLIRVRSGTGDLRIVLALTSPGGRAAQTLLITR